jgi:hypothetical protein
MSWEDEEDRRMRELHEAKMRTWETRQLAAEKRMERQGQSEGEGEGEGSGIAGAVTLAVIVAVAQIVGTILAAGLIRWL